MFSRFTHITYDPTTRSISLELSPCTLLSENLKTEVETGMIVLAEQQVETLKAALEQQPKITPERNDVAQMLLWKRCVMLNDKYPYGSTVTINKREYTVYYPFNVVHQDIYLEGVKVPPDFS